MRITTIEQAQKYLEDTSHTRRLFIASRKFGQSEELDFFQKEVFFIITSWNSPFIGWIENGHMKQRSLNDMNIPENVYNDWRVFTTKEEAEAYNLPAKKTLTTDLSPPIL